MMHPRGDTCPTCGSPHAPIRQARTVEQSFIHCVCGYELLVGKDGELPRCPKCGMIDASRRGVSAPQRP